MHILTATSPITGPDHPQACILRAHLRLASIENCAALGHHDLDSLAQQCYARERNQHDHRSIWLAAATSANPTETEEILAVAELELPLLDNLSTAYLNLCVDPAHRNRGIGSTLLAAAIDTARKASRNIVISFGYLPANAETSLLAADAVTASTQTAAFLSTAEGVRFPVRHGFKLEQVERLSTLSLADYVAQPSTPPAGYEFVSWQNTCPTELLAEVAWLFIIMSKDIPAGGSHFETEAWDEQRLRQVEQTRREAGTQSQWLVARHTSSGKLAGYTYLTHTAAKPSSAMQEDTFVLGSHRGRSLGLSMKVANLAAAIDRWPHLARVHTFNAQENSHMLAINEKLGFQEAAITGLWQLVSS